MTLAKLVAGEHADVWFWSQAAGVRTGQPHELPAEVVRAARAVAWEPAVTEHFERVHALDRELADHGKKDHQWQFSAAGTDVFVDRTLKRSRAVDDAGYDFRRRLGMFAERVGDAVARAGGGAQPQPPAVAHETPDEIANECAAVGARAACRAMVNELNKVLAGAHPDEWFGEHVVRMRTRRPDVPMDAYRAARAIAWEPPVTEQMNRVEALTGELAKYEASQDHAWKTSPAGQAYFADRARRRALAVQELGREFKRLLADFVKRLELIAG